jgi:hypothetical protein
MGARQANAVDVAEAGVSAVGEQPAERPPSAPARIRRSPMARLWLGTHTPA